jgi:hypothetical protein
VRERFGFEPRPMEGALGYLRRKPAEQLATLGGRDPATAG